MVLVLFDIDGTLLDCGPQVRPVFESALVETYGTAGRVDGYDFSGKTDDQIVHDLLGSVGLQDEEIAAGLPRAKSHYLDQLDRRLQAGGMTLMPGVNSMLEELTSRPDTALGLLTGNWETGARIKLSRFRLNGSFSFGAFGDGQRTRRNLPPVALARAHAATGQTYSVEETVIVGDSVLDVACARHHRIRCLAVATGRTDAEALTAAGADRVVPSLDDRAVLSWILSG